MPLGTWNIQGANHVTENKWNAGVRNLMTQRHLTVFCLQECGTMPLSAQALAPVNGISLYRWGETQSSTIPGM